MRQVPQYLLIGDGRVANHFRHYLFLLNISYLSWCRRDGIELLQKQLVSATHIILLIKDEVIDSFIATYLKNNKAYKIHFSGSLVSNYAYGAHPLMSFTQGLYEFEYYQKIPFILDENSPSFADLLPGLTNPHARLNRAHKAKYHAYCVMANNFGCLLWQKLMRGLRDEFGLDPSFALPILEQSMNNLLENFEGALTGPLVRNDHQTLQTNLNALEGDAFKDIYQSFVNAYHSEEGK